MVGPDQPWLTTSQYLDAVEERLGQALKSSQSA
jgi:hypothetical protein